MIATTTEKDKNTDKWNIIYVILNQTNYKCDKKAKKTNLS